jgi:antitoxin HicB
MPHPNIGSSFDSFLEEDGRLEEATAVAIKRVLAWRLAEEMRAQGISKTEMARRLQTSRSQLARLLDPQQTGVELETMQKAAAALGKRLHVDLVEA